MAAAQLGIGETIELAGDHRAVVVEVTKQQLLGVGQLKRGPRHSIGHGASWGSALSWLLAGP
jgi:hypothetical protein